MEQEPTREALYAEYTHAQLAIRALDFQIAQLESEKHRWESTCHGVVTKAMEAGISL